MKPYRSILLTVFLLSLFYFAQPIRGQEVNLENVQIDHPVPDFILENVQHYRQKTVSSDNLKGKFVVLCFWHRFCSGAYKNFSRMNRLAREFRGKVEFIMIGGRSNKSEYNRNEELDSLMALFERTRKMQNLQLPSSYDIDLYQRFVTAGAPHLIWIDDKGIVQAVTANIDSTRLEAFLAGKEFDFFDYSMEGLERSKQRPDVYDAENPFLVDGNGGKSDSFQYRSLITPYTNEMPLAMGITRKVKWYHWQGKLEGVAALEELYKLAYFGYFGNYDDWYREENYNQLVLDIKNKRPFTRYNYNIPIENIYWYSLIVPQHKRNPKSLMKIIQNDLDNYFGYQARIEKRMLPYWCITANEQVKEKIKTKNGPSKLITDQFTYVGAQNLPFTKYLKMLFIMIAPGPGIEFPIIDETGIEGNIDIPVKDVDLSNFEDTKKVLRKLGFDIKKAYKDFNVLVISDPISNIDNGSK
ncbi:peroxiredoxin family protein [Zhouia spongiae]|uniref:Peroxiredoxin family protein n=1 Tax=Zhouia spongiae TaxID=2202721 RepID=A0ABY3YMA0_9FLAO|nr:redoxin domain-containing protein [Zhouia spongiae]UNY98616.1 peroxiredoxin family protein [Zhouia spongiae]